MSRGSVWRPALLAIGVATTTAQAADTSAPTPPTNSIGMPMPATQPPTIAPRSARVPAGYGISVIDGSYIALPAGTPSPVPSGTSAVGTPMPAARPDPAPSNAGLNVLGQPTVAPASGTAARPSPTATSIHP